MFFSRSKTGDAVSRLAAGGAGVVETAFRGAQTASQKRNVVEELVNVKVSSPTETDFSADVSETHMRLNY